jgi:hypothetical protein
MAAPRASELEKVSADTKREAQKLLSAAGSKDLAKKALTSAAGHPADPTSQNDAFAKRWGFASYLEMFEASKALGEVDGKNCLVTHVGSDQWIVWSDHDLTVSHTYKSFEDARRHCESISSPAKEANTPPVA